MAHISSLFRVSTLAAMIAGFGFLSTPAQAGFEWKPGPKANATDAAVTAPVNPDMPPMPSEAVASDTLAKTTIPPLPSLPTAPLLKEDISAKPSMPDMAPPMKEPVPAHRAANALPDAVGFGSDLPLALGMRQIVPAQYAYQFDTGVDQGAKISWNGGKPWDAALNDAVKPLGYNAIIEGNTVRIVSTSTSVTPIVKSEMPPAAPIAPPMAMRAEAAPPTPTPVADTSKSVREVYVRRNAAGTEVEQRTPGKPEIVAEKKAATMSATDNGKTNGDEKSGFWNHVNPMNWQPDTAAAKPSPYNVNRTAGSVSTSKEVPQPASYNNSSDAGPTSRMSDNDARVDATKEPISKNPVPNAPDDVADTTSEANSIRPVGAPVILTRGPGEVSPPAAPVDLAKVSNDKESVFETKSAAPAILNTSEVGMWDAKQGDSLKTVLQKWSEKANVQLYWVPAQDYKLAKPIHLQGNYTDAVADVLGGYGDKGARPVGRLHPNLPNGPSVLIIEPAAS